MTYQLCQAEGRYVKYSSDMSIDPSSLNDQRQDQMDSLVIRLSELHVLFLPPFPEME